MTTNSGPGLLGEPTRTQRLTRYWVAHPRADLLLIVPIVVWLLADQYSHHKLIIVSLAPEVRRSLWVTLIGTSGTVAGLMLASVSILISLVKTPLSNLDRLFTGKQRRGVGETILGGMPTLAALFVLSIVASVTDGRARQGWWPIEALVVLALAASVSHFSRVVWIIRKLLTVGV